MVQSANIFPGQHPHHNTNPCKQDHELTHDLHSFSDDKDSFSMMRSISFLFSNQILFASIYSTIIFCLTDQPWELNRYTRFTLAYVLVTIVADGLGLLLGAIANPVVSIICFLFKFPKKNDLSSRFVTSNHHQKEKKTGFTSENTQE